MKWYLFALLALLPFLAGFAFHEAGWLAPAPAVSAPSSSGRSVTPREVRQQQARHWRYLVLQPTR